MRLTRLLGFTAVTLAGCLTLNAAALADYRIGVSIARVDDNFMTYVRNGLNDAAKKAGVTLQVEDAQGDVVRQLNQVQGFLSQKVDAIIVLPADTAAITKVTQAAVSAGIPLVYVNRRPDQAVLPKGIVAVASRDEEAGQLQMRYLAEKMGGKGNLAIIMGDLAQNATQGRTEGVKQVLKDYPGIKIVEQQSAEWQRSRSMDLTSNWILAGSQIDAIVANNDEMAIGAAMALQQSGKAKGSVPVIGIDGLPDGLAAIKRGQLAASVFQDPTAQASGAMQAALKMIKGEPVDSDVWVPYQLITPEQVSTFEQHFK